jgi:hypothetical protein
VVHRRIEDAVHLVLQQGRELACLQLRIALGVHQQQDLVGRPRRLECTKDHLDRVRGGCHLVADEPDRPGPLGSKPLRQTVRDVPKAGRGFTHPLLRAGADPSGLDVVQRR